MNPSSFKFTPAASVLLAFVQSHLQFSLTARSVDLPLQTGVIWLKDHEIGNFSSVQLEIKIWTLTFLKFPGRKLVAEPAGSTQYFSHMEYAPDQPISVKCVHD